MRARVLILIIACMIVAVGCERPPDDHRPEASTLTPVEAISLTLAWSHIVPDGRIGSALIDGDVAYNVTYVSTYQMCQFLQLK